MLPICKLGEKNLYAYKNGNIIKLFYKMTDFMECCWIVLVSVTYICHINKGETFKFSILFKDKILNDSLDE